jgi:hypothetical protein
VRLAASQTFSDRRARLSIQPKCDRSVRIGIHFPRPLEIDCDFNPGTVRRGSHASKFFD